MPNDLPAELIRMLKILFAPLNSVEVCNSGSGRSARAACSNFSLWCSNSYRDSADKLIISFTAFGLARNLTARLLCARLRADSSNATRLNIPLCAKRRSDSKRLRDPHSKDTGIRLGEFGVPVQ